MPETARPVRRPGEAADARRGLAPRDWVWVYLLSLMWGSSFLFNELALEGFAPMTIVTLRVGIAAAVMLVLFGDRAGRLGDLWRHRYRMAGFGMFGCALPFACYSFGQQYVDSSLAAVINSLMPLFTYLCAVVAGQERLGAMRLVGICLGLAGIVALLGPNAGDDPARVFGGLLCLLAAASYAVNTVLIKRHASDIHHASLAVGMVCWATILSVPAMLALEGVPDASPGATALLGVCGLGLVGTALAFRIFTKLIEEQGATNASIAVLIVPFNAVALGILVLGETVDAWFVAGAALILTSLVLMDRNLRQAAWRVAALARRS